MRCKENLPVCIGGCTFIAYLRDPLAVVFSSSSIFISAYMID